ncbi:unnamed protein product [Heligmosomoides polygyrus]|uniref:Tetraspanin n=1 Tax=Heligmosomoides polygyrus TaxID=6339 RepID=A0A183GG16_HELPZ|nr:unnamed protein product [Heligmosomoides polygyrus]
MTIQRTGGDAAKIALMIYTVLFWTFAAYIAIVAGSASLFVGFIGCCGAVQRMRCLIVGFMLCLFVLFLADVSIGTLALVFRNKFANGQLTVYIKNMTHTRYNRDAWVKPLLDTVQFYLASSDSTLEENLKSLVSFSYGVSMEMEENRKVTAMLDKLQFYQQCCGGESPRDYLNSFWFITNTERGTRSFVPPSCCRQSQMGRAWAPAPIDPMCTTYAYDSQAFASSVHNVVSAEVANSVLETLGPMGGVFRLLWLLLDSAHRI